MMDSDEWIEYQCVVLGDTVDLVFDDNGDAVDWKNTTTYETYNEYVEFYHKDLEETKNNKDSIDKLTW